MHRKELIALFFCLLAFPVTVIDGSATQLAAKKDRIIALPAEVVISERGTLVLDPTAEVGFVSSVASGSLISFSSVSGKVISSAQFGEMAGAPSMIEIGRERLIALPTANNPESGRPATVSIINATKADQLVRVALIVLPSDARLRPDSRALLTKDGRFGVIVSSSNDATLFSFNVETAQIVSKLLLYGQPTGIALYENDVNRTIAITNPTANNLFISKLDDQGQLSPVGTFIPPDACFDYSNDPEFSGDGRRVYVAGSKCDRLYVIGAENCILEEIIPIPRPQRVTVARTSEGIEMVGVTRLAQAAEPNGVTVLASDKGRLTIKASFNAPAGLQLSRVNNVVFNSDASLAFVGSASGILIAFDPLTGKFLSHKITGGELRRLIFSPTSRTVLAVRSTLIKDEIAVVDIDRLSKDKSGNEQFPRIHPEIKRISNQGTYVHLLIEGANFQSGSIVEFVKADKVVLQQSPVQVREKELTVIVPATKLKELGDFEVRVVTGNHTSTELARLETETALSGGNNQAIQRYSKTTTTPSSPGAIQKHSKTDTSLVSTSIQRPSRTGTPPTSAPIQRQSETGSSITSASAVYSVRPEVGGNVTRVVIDARGEASVNAFMLPNPMRIVIDIVGAHNSFGAKTLPVRSPHIQRIRTGDPKPGVVRVVLDIKGRVGYDVTREGGSIIVAVRGPKPDEAE
jgi:hypothetical protein